MDTPNLIANIITAGATSIATGATVFGVMWKVQKDKEKKTEKQKLKDDKLLKDEIQKDCKLHELKVSELKEKITAMENEHDSEIKEIRHEFRDGIQKLEENNRQDHGKIFDRIDELKNIMLSQKAG